MKNKKLIEINEEEKVDRSKVAYPENKRLKKLQVKANRQYREMVEMCKTMEEMHKSFADHAIKLCQILKEIEAEAIMPNFGDR